MATPAEAKKWLEWAEGTLAAQRWEDARYNLQKFWETKAAVYPTATAAERQTLDAQDARAHYLLSLLKTHDMNAAGTGYTAPFRPQRTQDEILRSGAAAEAAAQRSQALALATQQRLLAKQAGIQTRELPHEVWTAKEEAPNVYTQNFGGLPLWAWAAAAGAVGLVLLTRGSRGN